MYSCSTFYTCGASQAGVPSCPRAPRLFLALTSVVASSVQLEHFEGPLNDDPIRDVLVTHGFLGEKQAFESDRFYRDAVEFDRLGILAQRVVSLPVCVEHEIHHEGICNADVFAFLEPPWLDVFGSPIRQDHQSFLDALSRLRCCRDNHIDISGRTLIAMSGKRVAADQ